MVRETLSTLWLWQYFAMQHHRAAIFLRHLVCAQPGQTPISEWYGKRCPPYGCGSTLLCNTSYLPPSPGLCPACGKPRFLNGTGNIVHPMVVAVLCYATPAIFLRHLVCAQPVANPDHSFASLSIEGVLESCDDPVSNSRSASQSRTGLFREEFPLRDPIEAKGVAAEVHHPGADRRDGGAGPEDL